MFYYLDLFKRFPAIGLGFVTCKKVNEVYFKGPDPNLFY